MERVPKPVGLLHQYASLKEEMQKWNQTQKRTKVIISFLGLLNVFKIGWGANKRFVYYYYHPHFQAFLEVLKQKGYIETYCVVPCLGWIPGSLTNSVVICALPSMDWHTAPLKRIYVYARPRVTLSLNYKQVQYLVKKLQQTFLFHTPQGLVPHSVLLKKKIGGILFCSLK